MKSKYENFLLNVIGVFLLIIGISAILNSLYIRNPTQIFWGCYLGLILIGSGIIFRNSYLIMSQIYILAIPLLIWDIDFLYWLIMNESLWGITDYFFIERTLNIGKLVSLQHLFTVPLSLYAVKRIGLKRTDAWKWSFAQITIVFFLILFITPPDQNINCVFSPCGNIASEIIPYRITWFAVFFSMTFLTSLVTNKIILNKKRKR